MAKPLNQSHILFLSDHRLDLPQTITSHLGTVTTFIGKKHTFFRFLSNLSLNWRIRNLHATNRIDAVIIDHPKFFFDYLRLFASKHGIPIIADNLTNSFDRNIVTRTQFHGFLLPSIVINGNQTSAPIEDHTGVIPLALAKADYWKLAGFKSKILNIAVIALKPNAAEYATLATALDVVKSLDPEIGVDIISSSDQDPTPLTTRLRKAHLIINVSTDPVWTETTAAAVAAGIPLITPKRPLHQFIPPKNFPGYIIADWQIDTLTTIIQNSMSHPEETYRVAKNAQAWLKHNLGNTFLPLTWVNALQALLSPDPETMQ